VGFVYTGATIQTGRCIAASWPVCHRSYYELVLVFVGLSGSCFTEVLGLSAGAQATIAVVQRWTMSEMEFSRSGVFGSRRKWEPPLSA